MGRRFTLASRLAPHECLERLRRSTQRPPLLRFTMPARETFYCRIRGNTFRLFVLGPRSWHNSFMPFFHGAVHPAADGSEIRCRIRPRSFAIGFVALWFAWPCAAVALILWAAVTGRAHFSAHPAWAVLGVALVAAAGAGVVAGGLAIGRPQVPVLDRFVRTTLVAA